MPETVSGNGWQTHVFSHKKGLHQLKNVELVTGDAFIDGKWVKKEKVFKVIDPATSGVLGEVSDCELQDFQQAIVSAHDAQQRFFASTTATVRGAMLKQWYNLIIANQEDLAVILCLENGKTLAEARAEIVYSAGFVSWFAEEATRSYGHTIPSSFPNTSVTTVREPIGVCGIITPWNFPAAMITRKVGPALAAGCSVVIKPPSETPYTCLALVKLAMEAGLPPKTIQVCPTKDRKAATELAVHPLVRKISFTGSTNVGKMLAALAAKTLKRVSLELGGNAPFIVFDDADLPSAVEGAMISKFRGTGQTCVCTNRIYVQSGVAERFTKLLVESVAKLRVGPGLDHETTQGPLVNSSAIDKVREHVEDAVSKGAKLEFQEKSHNGEKDGFFCPPVVLSGVNRSMAVATDETFGPLAAVFEFEDEQEVIELANDTEFGLAGYVFTQNLGVAHRVAGRLQVGMVGVNTGKISAAESPFGGVKESGYGREGSLYGLEEYQTIKSVTISIGGS